MSGSNAGFATHRWCDPGLITFSFWTAVSHFFPLISSCISSSVDAMQGKTKLSKLILVKSLSGVI